MKVDNFTKVILTIIAINLTILTVSQVRLFPNAFGADNPSLNPINFTTGTYLPVNADGTIDVNIKSIDASDVLDVNIEEISGYSFWDDEIPVEIKNQPIDVK